MRSLVLVVILLLFSSFPGCLDSIAVNDTIEPEEDVEPPVEQSELPEPFLATECLNGHSNLAMHIHPSLSIQIENTTYSVAADVGIDTETCPSAMHVAHTHDDSGKIHVETHEPANVTLGIFTEIWGILFDETQFGPYQVNETHELVMTVDGVVSEDWGDHVFSDGESILIHYRERQ